MGICRGSEAASEGGRAPRAAACRQQRPRRCPAGCCRGWASQLRRGRQRQAPCTHLVEWVGRVVRPDVQHIHVVLGAVQLLKACTAAACRAARRREGELAGPGGCWQAVRRRRQRRRPRWRLQACRRSDDPSGPPQARVLNMESSTLTGLERLCAGAVPAARVRHQDQHPRLAVALAPRRVGRRAQLPQRVRVRHTAAAKLRRGQQRRWWASCRQQAPAGASPAYEQSKGRDAGGRQPAAGGRRQGTAPTTHSRRPPCRRLLPRRSAALCW